MTILLGCQSRPYVFPDPEVDIENLKSTVKYLTTVKQPRNHTHPKSLKQCANYISQKLSSYGYKPDAQLFTVRKKNYYNVIATVGPNQGERLIIGAHYDVCGNQAGADDNASGIAGLLEIARFAMQHKDALPYRVDFVAYSLEEPPFFGTKNMGSYVHAKSLKDAGIAIKGMICLEMIGFFSEQKNSQSYPLAILNLFYPDTGDFITVASSFGNGSLSSQVTKNLKATDMNVEVFKAPSALPGIDFSDHRNYWHFGYPAVMVTDTAFYRNPHYHKQTDTMDTLNFTKMREVTKGLCWTLLNIQ